MDLPLGALTEGFEDRLVLETRSDFVRWGGCLLYLLMVPIALLGAGALTMLLSVGIGVYITTSGSVQSLVGCTFLPTLGPW